MTIKGKQLLMSILVCCCIAFRGTVLLAQATQAGDTLSVIQEVRFTGNKVTKDHIIERELMFGAGDTLGTVALQRLVELSRENLINTSLFNFVKAEVTADEAGRTTVTYHLTERWYIWPWPVIEFADRNFNTWWRDNRDLSRMSYGVILKWENFRGRKEKLYFTARFGYNEKYGFDYTIPYLNQSETLGLGIGASYGRSHEVPVNVEGNELVYYKDEDNPVINTVNAYASLIFRREIYNTHYMSVSYERQAYADTLLMINPSFTPTGEASLEFLSLSYMFKSDHRDNKAYPLAGYYFDLEVVKHGVGAFEDAPDLFAIYTNVRKYFVLSPRFFFASGLHSKFSNDNRHPFLLSRCIGYGRDIVRGYEYYVVHGHNFGIFKNNLKFALLPVRERTIGFIRSEKFSRIHYAFYLNAFIDMGYADQNYKVGDLGNDLENNLLIGYGLGIDFVTYYDLVFRLEYAMNRLGDSGFFLHFIAPI